MNSAKAQPAPDTEQASITDRAPTPGTTPGSTPAPGNAAADSPAPAAQRQTAVTRQSIDLQVCNRPWLTVMLLIAGDLLALTVAGLVGISLRYLLGIYSAQFTGFDFDRVALQLWPFVLLFPIVFAAVGMYSGMALYPSIALGPAEELRRSTLAITTVFLALAAATMLFPLYSPHGVRRDPAFYSRSIFLISWLVAVVTVPTIRAMVRGFFAKKPWWGHGVVVLGAGITGRMVVESLHRHPELGLKPVAMLDDDHTRHGECQGVPVIGGLEYAQQIADKNGITYAIVAMPGVQDHRLKELYARYGDIFPHLLIIPSLVGFSSLWVSARDLGGIMGLEVRQRLLLLGPRLLKRTLDLVLTILAGAVLLIPLAMIAVWIKLDSTGPVFFIQQRPGFDGKPFRIYKFRTMYVDAPRRLKDLTPQQRTEFRDYGKIQDDPRVTRAGRLLRRFSLDEFPQLWNVLRGEMSLVGPRAYLRTQLKQLADHKPIIQKVPPGITGIWQISGRSEVSMENRLELDAYYVRNWSVWLDLYILLRTIGVVFMGKGAY